VNLFEHTKTCRIIQWKKILYYLTAALDNWLAAGDQIVLGIDLNENVLSAAFTRALSSRGLLEIIMTKHGSAAPPTYQRGSSPIDGMYVSAPLKDAYCGYLPFLGYHRVLWIDIPMDLAFGCSSLPSTPIRARRLKLQDPRIVHQY
jgi:hypothetical protein